jgi:hypothetical protein
MYTAMMIQDFALLGFPSFGYSKGKNDQLLKHSLEQHKLPLHKKVNRASSIEVIYLARSSQLKQKLEMKGCSLNSPLRV